MKKFKIKNRQKRKYTRRRATVTYFSASRSLMVGFIPSLLLAIALMATFVIQVQPTSLPDSNFQNGLSSLISQGIYNTAQSISNAYNHISVTFNLPQIQLPTIHINTPKVNVKPFIPNFPTQIFIPFWTAIAAISVIAWHDILTFLGWIDPRPYLSALGEGIIWLSNTLVFIFAAALSGIGYLFSLSFVISLQITTGLFKSLFAATVAFIHMTEFVAMTFVVLTVDAIVFIVNLIDAILRGIVFVVVSTFNGLVSFVKAVIHLILIPFQLLGESFDKMKPYLNFLGAHVKFSLSELNDSFGNLFGGLAKLFSVRN